ncbi:hypothetical protein MY04_4429 [Flammeovirga sp. MY04]|uniref:glycoside hydrolase family 88 protein n=1 Tax=Flammeovirga sp. MY04 TaxID=1191459 RepID=UPI000806261E|nr:glycoside hydrolase family 88 protein [Flammeovirga sp. MY04]ANQ51767.1 hypothetical protein MY04_4429 [Flammeovirga sp. MY04]
MKLLNILMSLCLLGCYTSVLAQHSTPKSYDFVVAEDGAWTWYNDERAAYKKGKLYTSYVKSDGKTALSVNDISTGYAVGSEVLLSTWAQKDDHNNASVLMREDGKIMAFYSKHIGPKKNYFRTSLVEEPKKQSDWGDEIMQLTTNDSDHKGATYNNAYQLSAEQGKIYNFMRTNNFNPNVKTYDKDGQPLHDGKDFILFKNGDGSVRPYVKYTSNNVDRIDFFFTDGHPRKADNNLYHCYYQTNKDGTQGKIYQTDGSVITDLASVFAGKPIDVQSVHKLYHFGSDGTKARPWTHNINYDKKGNPVVSYSKQIDINTITYHYAKWNGNLWTNHLVCDAGKGLYNGEDDYTGIITINPYNTNQIFMSSNKNPMTGVEGERYEIYSAVTKNDGETWTWTAITEHSEKDNLRPYVPKGIKSKKNQVALWFYGEYTTYMNYKAKIVGEFIHRNEHQTVGRMNTKKEVKKIILKVNDYWQANNKAELRSFWDHAAYHTGNMAAYEITKKDAYRQYSIDWAKHNEWKGAKSDIKSNWKYKYGETDDFVLFGDWQICFQTYIDLYNLSDDKEEAKVARAKEVMKYEMSTSRNDYWWWADGLYMVMPVMTKLYHLTGDKQYLDKLYEYFAYSKSIMYDEETGLFFRDARYVFPKHKSVNGLKDFWARGDGWVFAGLAKVLQDVPEDWEHRAYFEGIYKKMAVALKSAQQQEGYWTRSILDPKHAPGPETSGTAFFTYGYLWGMNNGILSVDEYAPVVKKSWNYLSTTALNENGKVGYVQPIGERAIPGQQVDENSTADFGVGAYLLAASEMYKFLGKHKVN